MTHKAMNPCSDAHCLLKDNTPSMPGYDVLVNIQYQNVGSVLRGKPSVFGLLFRSNKVVSAILLPGCVPLFGVKDGGRCSWLQYELEGGYSTTTDTKNWIHGYNAKVLPVGVPI